MPTSNIYNDVAAAAQPLADIVADKQHILIVTHVNPDGDAVGSLAALSLALEQRGHTVTALVPSPLPVFTRTIPTSDRIQVYSTNQHLPASIDVVILVDTGDVQRIARVWHEQQPFLLNRPMIVIDHHVTNSGEGICNLVDPTRSSTCELLYELLAAWNVEITSDIATALLFGIITDTQSFRTSNSTPSALRAAAALLDKGADRNRVVREVYNNIPFSYGKLLAFALTEMQSSGSLVWTRVTQAMQQAAGADDEASAEVTDYLSALGGFRASALFKERRDGTVKVSLRSIPGVDVSSVAQQFGGGGHRQAAGCTILRPLVEVEPLVIAALAREVQSTA
ncbi:MAG: bifunctional oligoribonuclease/PAP phosphatase NrnA [Herpetosiphon sp.]